MDLILNELKDLDGIVETIKHLEDTRAKYLCDNQDLRENIEGIKDNIEQMESIHIQNEIIIKEQEAFIQTLQREQKTLQHLIETKDIEIAELKGIQRQFDEAKRENENLFTDLTVCHNTLCKLKELREKHDNTLTDKDNVVTRQQHEIMQVESKVQDYKQNVDCLIEETQALLKEYENCKKHLDELLEEKDQIAQKLHLCEQARHNLDDCVHKNQTYIKELKAELTKEQANNMRIQLKITALEDELFKAKRNIVLLKDDIVVLNNERDEKQSEVKCCKMELKRRTNEFEEYKNTIRQLKSKIVSDRKESMACGSTFGATKVGTTRIGRNEYMGVNRAASCMPERSMARRDRFAGGARLMTSCIGPSPGPRRNISLARARPIALTERYSNMSKCNGGRRNSSVTFQTNRREQPNHILGGTNPSGTSFQRYKPYGTCISSCIGNTEYFHSK